MKFFCHFSLTTKNNKSPSLKMADITRKECKDWVKNHLFNPRTGRKINPTNRIYRQLMEKCMEFKITIFPKGASPLSNPGALRAPSDSKGEEKSADTNTEGISTQPLSNSNHEYSDFDITIMPENFKVPVHAVLKQFHPSADLTTDALLVVNQLVNLFIGRFREEFTKMTKAKE